MTDDQKPARGVSAQEFFAAGVDGGSMTAAHHATRIAYSTVHRASRGEAVHRKTAMELERWSRSLGAELFISAVATMGLTDDAPPSADEDAVEDITPSTPPEVAA